MFTHHRNAKSARTGVLAALGIAVLSLGLAACGPQIDNRGHKPNPDDLARLKTGTSTRSDVQNILGSPSSRSVYGGETWFYISATWEREAFYKPEETERQILAIDFDKSGVVKDMRTLDKDSGKEVAISEKITPTTGHTMSLVEQMVGNLGRFNSQDKTEGKANNASGPDD